MGASSMKPCGRGSSFPLCTTKVARCVSLVPRSSGSRPRRRHRAKAQGFSEIKESGPSSSRKSSCRSVAMTPPSRSPASSSVNRSGCSRSRLSSSSLWAAARPAIPPPTMTIWGRGLCDLVMPDPGSGPGQALIRHPEAGGWGWIPAFAGMTGRYMASLLIPPAP